MSRAGRWAGWAALAAVLVWSALATELSLGRVIEGLPYMWDFIRRMVPPDPSVGSMTRPRISMHDWLSGMTSTPAGG